MVNSIEKIINPRYHGFANIGSSKSKLERQSPAFEEIVSSVDLKDVGLVFNAQTFGPASFIDLKRFDYGEGFRMPTISELVPLVYAAMENQRRYKTAEEIMTSMGCGQIVGNTITHFFDDGFFVEDNPRKIKTKVKDSYAKIIDIIIPRQEFLKKRLGSREEQGVVFSGDGNLRFVPYGFKIGEQSTSEFVTNPGVLAVVKNQENAEKLARFSKHSKLEFELSPSLLPFIGQSRISSLHFRYWRGQGLLGDSFGICAGDFPDSNVKHTYGVRTFQKAA